MTPSSRGINGINALVCHTGQSAVGIRITWTGFPAGFRPHGHIHNVLAASDPCRKGFTLTGAQAARVACSAGLGRERLILSPTPRPGRCSRDARVMGPRYIPSVLLAFEWPATRAWSPSQVSEESPSRPTCGRGVRDGGAVRVVGKVVAYLETPAGVVV